MENRCKYLMLYTVAINGVMQYIVEAWKKWSTKMSFNIYYECKIPCENEEISVRAGAPAVGNDGRK